MYFVMFARFFATLLARTFVAPLYFVFFGQAEGIFREGGSEGCSSPPQENNSAWYGFGHKGRQFWLEEGKWYDFNNLKMFDPGASGKLCELRLDREDKHLYAQSPG